MTSPAVAATGAWTKAGDLPAAAAWHGQEDGAVVLKSGQVLLTAGVDASSAATGRTAVFDPTGRKWTAGPPLTFPRRLHTATLLDGGKVLVVGGTSGASPLSSPLTATELYDPAGPSGPAWKTVGDLREARSGHSAVLLADKRVLVTGGTGARSGGSVRALASAEIYDPVAETWSDAPPMTDARTGHCALRIKGGQVLVAGGSAPVSDDGSAALAFCELYSPEQKRWTPTGSLPRPRSGHRAVLVSDTTALVIGGATPGVAGDGTFDAYHALTGEKFDLSTGAWTPIPSAAGGRGLHRVVPLGSGRFLVVGGTADQDNGAGYQSAVIYDDGTRKWDTAAGLATGRWAFAAAPLGTGKVLVAGGVVASGVAGGDPQGSELTATSEIFTAEGVS
ncbi:Kelch repeat-containing protein [Streptomyces aureocirculatus]|uniref:Kelch repeat-containing protein n=1 Tax=Streptomyces aureocirculatus TaxID=67275 RepID=UPI0004C87AC0|nr:kelch repeat-containing protein [Streptomyces aureocirculatus]